MANKEIIIPIGGENIKVPAWSTEETLLAVAGYSEATAKALTAMLKDNDKEQKVASNNQQLFKKMLSQSKETTTTLREGIKNDSKISKALQEAYGQNGKMSKAASGFTNAFNKQDLEGMTKAIAGAGIVGTVAGIAAGTLTSFTKNIVELTNVGVGLGQELTDLRGQATAAGLNLENYGKIISSNMPAMLALGPTVAEGAKEFSKLSAQVNRNAREFNNFGMSNTEMNQIIADEIELRRISGMEQSLIADDVAGSMNKLMNETLGLAKLTGKDRRELYRARIESSADPIISAYKATLDPLKKANFETLSVLRSFGGPAADIAKAMEYAASTQQDYRVVLGGTVGKMAAMNTGVADVLSELDRFRQQNEGVMSSAEYKAGFMTIFAKLQDAIDEPARLMLSRQSANLTAYGQEALSLLELAQQAAGISTDAAKNNQEMLSTGKEVAATDLAAIPAAFERAANTVADATLNSTLGVVDEMAKLLGADVDALNSTGEIIVAAFNGITDMFEPGEGLAEGLWGAFSKLDGKTQALITSFGVLAAATKLGSGSGVGSGVVGGAIGGSAAAAVVGGTSGVASGLGKMLPLLKKIPVVGTALTAGLGIFDEKYQEAGYNFIERSMLGVAEGALDLFDVGQNLAGMAINAAAGTDFRTDYDLGGEFKDFAAGPVANLLGYTQPKRDIPTETAEMKKQTRTETVSGTVSGVNSVNDTGGLLSEIRDIMKQNTDEARKTRIAIEFNQ